MRTLDDIREEYLFLDGDDNPTLDTIMTRPAVSIGEDCPLTDAARLMAEQGIRHLTVVNPAGSTYYQLQCR